MKKNIIISVIVIFLLLLVVAGFVLALNLQTIASTNDWHDFYGYIKDAKVGDIITAKDPNGIVCGSYKIDTLGKYGFMHVYADDSATTLDEGAKTNDIITFYLNGNKLNQNFSFKGNRVITFLNLTLTLKDTDKDKIPDIYDLCSGTPAKTMVDKNGCSALQFCGLIKISSTKDNSKCQLADWKANEAGKKPNDCQVKTRLFSIAKKRFFSTYCTNTKNAN